VVVVKTLLANLRSAVHGPSHWWFQCLEQAKI